MKRDGSVKRFNDRKSASLDLYSHVVMMESINSQQTQDKLKLPYRVSIKSWTDYKVIQIMLYLFVIMINKLLCTLFT